MQSNNKDRRSLRAEIKEAGNLAVEVMSKLNTLDKGLPEGDSQKEEFSKAKNSFVQLAGQLKSLADQCSVDLPELGKLLEFDPSASTAKPPPVPVAAAAPSEIPQIITPQEKAQTIAPNPAAESPQAGSPDASQAKPQQETPPRVSFVAQDIKANPLNKPRRKLWEDIAGAKKVEREASLTQEQTNALQTRRRNYGSYKKAEVRPEQMTVKTPEQIAALDKLESAMRAQEAAKPEELRSIEQQLHLAEKAKQVFSEEWGAVDEYIDKHKLSDEESQKMENLKGELDAKELAKEKQIGELRGQLWEFPLTPEQIAAKKAAQEHLAAIEKEIGDTLSPQQIAAAKTRIAAQINFEAVETPEQVATLQERRDRNKAQELSVTPEQKKILDEKIAAKMQLQSVLVNAEKTSGSISYLEEQKQSRTLNETEQTRLSNLRSKMEQLTQQKQELMDKIDPFIELPKAAASTAEKSAASAKKSDTGGNRQ